MPGGPAAEAIDLKKVLVGNDRTATGVTSLPVC